MTSIATTAASRGRRLAPWVGLALAFGLGYWWRGDAERNSIAQRADADHSGDEHGHTHATGTSHSHDDNPFEKRRQRPAKQGSESDRGGGLESDRAHHDHSHEDDVTMVELSEQAKGNIGLKVSQVALGSFTRTITLPAIVVERAGLSQIDVAAPLTGVVTQIHVIAGQAVEAGQPLFEMRLTHEELVQSQAEFLHTVEELDVVNRNLERLENVAEKGAIAGKVVLERQHDRHKLEASLRAREQALALHGLTAEQIASIRQDRKLVGSLTIRAPLQRPSGEASGEWLLQVEQLNVEIGHSIEAGQPLCILTDHAQLYVEGKAFPEDAELLNRAAQSGASVCAVLESGKSPSEADQVCSLKILYLGSKIDPESRVLSCFATLPNELVRDDRMADGRRFVGWRFRPGQRMQLKAPAETWENRIVLPVEAVVQEGPESYVFREEGDHFHRCPVRVEFRDPLSVVLAADNEIKPGDRLAMNSAHQLQLVLKNRITGGDAAGHTHSH